MRLEQIYTNCLAHAAYYLESNGEVAIFDPLRETRPYIEKAKQSGATITYVFETHFHADFVSGHLDLAKETGAKIVYGPTAKPSFKALVAEDGQVFELGTCKVKAIHTPGHTLESTVYLISDENGKETSLISGDTLFIGDVGRPDLAQHIKPGLTKDKLAGMLFHSLRDKIIPLSNDIIIYPNHGAGSACGKNMSKNTSDTLGNQKKLNYALNEELTEEEFKKQVLSGLTAPPSYFPTNVLLNINGYKCYDDVVQESLRPINTATLGILMKQKSNLVLDTRDAEVFAQGHIPGSLNIGLNGTFAPWVGEIIKDVKQVIILVAAKGREEEAITRLSRVGYDGVIGYLEGGFENWQEKGNIISSIQRMDASELLRNNDTSPKIIDVRKKCEFDTKHIIGSDNIPLNQIFHHLSRFSKDQAYTIICAGGYRSMIAASILRQNGWENLVDIRDGFSGIEQTDIPSANFKCPIENI